MGSATRLLRYLGPYKSAFVVSVIAATIASVMDGFTFALVIPFLRALFDLGPLVGQTPTGVERVLDVAISQFTQSGDHFVTVRNIVLLILLAVAAKSAASYLASYLSITIEERVMQDLRCGLYEHIHRLGLGFFQRMKGGQLQSRLFNDTEHARLLFNRGFQSVLRSGVLILVYLAILFSISWRLGLLTLLLAPSIALVMRPILSRMRSRFREAFDDRGELSAIVGETTAGARLVKAHAAEAYEERRFSEVSRRYVGRTLRAYRLSLLASPLSETLGAGVFVLLLLAGSWAALQGQTLRPELFIAFLAVTLRLLHPVKAIAQFPAFALQAVAGADRLFEILDRTPDDVDEPDTPAFPGLDHEIVFEDVWFGYRDEDFVLRGIDLTVPRGAVVAIVGHSGAGKSTMMDLLPRFIDPQRGRVCLDGVPTVEYSRRSLRQTLSIVSQETVIFNDTVFANIAYGEESEAGRAQVEAAARAANAHSFIQRLPQGYDTVLGERGAQLSGGERQRIAIARVLLRDPPILILDEATSALDAESEQLVQEAVAKLLENRTVLVIAHRLSTVRRAEKIAVLDDGRIVEEGRHEELVTGGGLYQRLYELTLVGDRQPQLQS